MSYRKIHVDNTTCWRRFHLSWDDTSPAQDKVEVKCLHCGVTVFASEQHPQVKLCRDENLIQNVSLSHNRISECKFQMDKEKRG